MDGHAFLKSVVVTLEKRVGVLYAFALVPLLFSPFILNDVLIIILTPVVIAYSKQHRVDPAPMVVAEVTLTTVSSALTPIGNPQNILLWSASGITFGRFVEGTWLAVAVSACLSILVLLPYARRLGRSAEASPAPFPWRPGAYLLLVAFAAILSDLAASRPYVPLGVAFLAGFLFTYRTPRKVYAGFDLRALLVLCLFVSAVTLFAVVLSTSLVPFAAPVAAGAQPYSGLFFAAVSEVMSNVPATQLVINTVGVGAGVASKLAVAAGLAGNLGPIASFANLLALQICRGEGVPLRKILLLQLAVGAVSFIPALF